MTKGTTVVMAFMMKKKKYKFQVDVCLEELLEVPFVSAVLFAKVRLLDGGNFQDHSSREEVREHSVKWGAGFSFACKMTANASTGVLEPCILRVSVRKESKGGRSFHKLGFVDLNLAEFAGAGLATRRYLLEGYDTRHRQDNSMLRLSIKMNMLSGDILFKAPSPSLNHKPVPAEDQTVEPHDFSSGSLAGSIASGSSGFGSLPKKRPPLLTSELLVGQSVIETCTGNPETVIEPPPAVTETEESPGELGHSRNSSNTSQMSKASGYSSVHSHSRQSSSGDSGHIRSLHRQKWCHITNPQHNFSPLSPSLTLMNPQQHKFWNNKNAYPLDTSASTTIVSDKEIFSTPKGVIAVQNFNNNKNSSIPPISINVSQVSSNGVADISGVYATPHLSNVSSASSSAEYKTPEGGNVSNGFVFPKSIHKQDSLSTISEGVDLTNNNENGTVTRHSFGATQNSGGGGGSPNGVKHEGVFRSKSDFEIPRNVPAAQKPQKTDNFFGFLTPLALRRTQNGKAIGSQSTPKRYSPPGSGNFKVPGSPVLKSIPNTRTTSLNSLRSGDGQQVVPSAIIRNPSSSSLVLSETGSLDRAKAAFERRKKAQGLDTELDRVETTRVNPAHLITELLKNTNLEPADDSAETSGLQLFIAKDGTASLGSREVKSQMSTGGAQLYKQVVMEDKR